MKLVKIATEPYIFLFHQEKKVITSATSLATYLLCCAAQATTYNKEYFILGEKQIHTQDQHAEGKTKGEWARLRGNG